MSVSGPFVSLHNHTELGSPLDGMNDVEDLFIRAKEVNHPGVAVTDHGTMTAIFDAWKASKKHGVKLIPGMEAYFTPDLSDKKNYHIVLLAQNEVGYRNILRLNYEAYRNQVSGYMGKQTPRISWEHIEQFNQGVIALTACSNGLIAKTLITEGNEEEALCYIDRFNSIFKDRFFLEIQPHNLQATGKNGKEVNQRKLNEAMIRLSHDKNIPYVITCDAHYRDKDHAKYHDFMLAIKDKKPINDPDRFRYGVQDMYLKTYEEITSFFGPDIAKKGMENSIKILNACDNPTYIEPKGAILPKFPVQNEGEYQKFKTWSVKTCPDIDEDKSYLRYKCMAGFKEKLSHLEDDQKKEYWDRVKKELNVMEEKNFSSYMLIVADFVNWAKSQGMPCSPARGSCAGSLVAFLTGITTVDPIKYDLLFERFQNKEKKSFPDIDSDFADPAKVKEYLKEKYGAEKVASISNWSTLSPKVIIKDVARSLEIGGDKSEAFKIANHLTSIMPDTETVEQAMKESKEFAAYMKKYPELYENACKLQGLTRNWSVHAAGVVISDRPLYEIVPLRIDAESGLVVTQWEKTRCEDFGLVKMDLLGLNTLNVITDTFALIEEVKDQKLTIEDIPLGDPETFRMISRGETAGVFQLESSLTPLCMKIKPKNIEEISDINALGRPSCSSEQRASYINRKLGIDDISYGHKKLENALRKTLGVSLYEETMMTIAKDCAGWDLNQADALRKITKLKGKDPDLVLKTEANFIADSMKTSGMKYEEAKQIWEEQIAVYGNYGFNRSLKNDELIRVMTKDSSGLEIWRDVEIQNIKPGCWVRSRDEESGKDIIIQVKDNHYHGKLKVFEIKLDTGEVVKCTINHKFRTNTGEMLPLWKILEDKLEIVVNK
jgi:DNA polymerase III subunit alpha